ncbi:hypothetical protein EVAR_944_1 [Eumeta japonica]|uniref:Uncharacterized protein n=1 Tax=Eumeta variegata TaxID=151549 RepID=A0A4C1SGY7_EUMVA|nr:hypothetical protein EVAR_944_1 [Eumeta japonica]
MAKNMRAAEKKERKDRGGLYLRITSFAVNSERQSFVRCTVPTSHCIFLQTAPHISSSKLARLKLQAAGLEKKSVGFWYTPLARQVSLATEGTRYESDRRRMNKPPTPDLGGRVELSVPDDVISSVTEAVNRPQPALRRRRLWECTRAGLRCRKGRQRPRTSTWYDVEAVRGKSSEGHRTNKEFGEHVPIHISVLNWV